MQKQILYIDIDGVVADFMGRMRMINPEIDNPQVFPTEWDVSMELERIVSVTPGFFRNLWPIKDAKECIKLLDQYFEIYFLSTPYWNISSSWSEKVEWLKEHFADLADKRLILSHNKHLNVGHYLIDNTTRHGADRFTGVHIHFGTDKFPDWKSVTSFLIKKRMKHETVPHIVF